MNYPNYAKYIKTKNGHERTLDRNEFRALRDCIAEDESDKSYIDDKLNAGYKIKTIFGIIERES